MSSTSALQENDPDYTLINECINTVKGQKKLDQKKVTKCNEIIQRIAQGSIDEIREDQDPEEQLKILRSFSTIHTVKQLNISVNPQPPQPTPQPTPLRVSNTPTDLTISKCALYVGAFSLITTLIVSGFVVPMAVSQAKFTANSTNTTLQEPIERFLGNVVEQTGQVTTTTVNALSQKAVEGIGQIGTIAMAAKTSLEQKRARDVVEWNDHSLIGLTDSELEEINKTPGAKDLVSFTPRALPSLMQTQITKQSTSLDGDYKEYLNNPQITHDQLQELKERYELFERGLKPYVNQPNGDLAEWTIKDVKEKIKVLEYVQKTIATEQELKRTIPSLEDPIRRGYKADEPILNMGGTTIQKMAKESLHSIKSNAPDDATIDSFVSYPHLTQRSTYIQEKTAFLQKLSKGTISEITPSSRRDYNSTLVPSTQKNLKLCTTALQQIQTSKTEGYDSIPAEVLKPLRESGLCHGKGLPTKGRVSHTEALQYVSNELDTLSKNVNKTLTNSPVTAKEQRMSLDLLTKIQETNRTISKELSHPKLTFLQSLWQQMGFK